MMSSPGRGPQVERGESQQPGAGADVGAVAHHHAARFHRAEHGEASSGGGVLAGAERLARRNREVAHPGLVQRRMVGGVDMEPPGADRLEPLLAHGDPVGFGQFFDGELWRFARKQRGHGGFVGLGRFAWQPRFEPPVVGAVLGDLAPGDDDLRIPFGHVLVRQ
jgi:hypothetical protein